MSSHSTHVHQSAPALSARACEFAMSYRGICAVRAAIRGNGMAANWLNASTDAAQPFAGSFAGMTQTTKQRGLRRRLH